MARRIAIMIVLGLVGLEAWANWDAFTSRVDDARELLTQVRALLP